MGDSLPYEFGERTIEIHRHDMPSAWINYLSNGRLHAFVSQAGGGYCWWKTPWLFRLTRYRMLGGLRIAPSIPSGWAAFSVTRRCRGTTVAVTVQNPQHVESGVKRLVIDGQELPCEPYACIPYASLVGRRRAEVTAVLG